MTDRKTALITGASGGIGAAIADRFASEGYCVFLNYTSEKSGDAVSGTVGRIKAAGGEAFAFRADVSDSSQVDAMVGFVMENAGHIDVLVNNAGITRDMISVRMSDEDFARVVDVNLKGTFFVSRRCAREMLKARRGSIVCVSSVVGLSGNAGQANYAASKAGMIGMVKSLAKEYASRGISVNAVAPGAVDTAMFRKIGEENVKKVLEMIPFGRAAKPEEVADGIWFLANSTYVTGQVLQIDGGMRL